MTTYVVVGDSQAEGLLMSTALPFLLGERLVGSYDHRGWSSARLLSDGAIGSAVGRAAATGSKLLIFSGGNDNDVMESTEAFDRYKRTLLDIVRAIARKSALAGVPIDVVWFGPVFALEPWNARQHPQTARAMATILRSSAVRTVIADEPGARVTIRFVDAQGLTRDLARVENVHLSAGGYRTFAERVVSAVEGGGGLLTLALFGAAWYAAWRAYKARGSFLSGTPDKSGWGSAGARYRVEWIAPEAPGEWTVWGDDLSLPKAKKLLHTAEQLVIRWGLNAPVRIVDMPRKP